MHFLLNAIYEEKEKKECKEIILFKFKSQLDLMWLGVLQFFTTFDYQKEISIVILLILLSISGKITENRKLFSFNNFKLLTRRKNECKYFDINGIVF
jgi:hypothetical protein